ncbi:MAG: hypothetical protein LJE91_15700 [Gammaproteobacteria bacterium]|nr:hypothetical protein [Gammaproteobacteria bacterium]
MREPIFLFRQRRWSHALVVLALLSAIPACGEKQLRERLEEEGYPPEYIDGYMDGCVTGYARAGNPQYTFTRQLSEFLVDERYASGWERGETECKRAELGRRRVEWMYGSD